MPPPELAGNTPWLDILQPVEIDLAVLLRQDRDVAIAHRINRGLHNLVGVHKPLIGQHRLDHNLGAVAERLHDFLFFNKGHQLGAFLPVFLVDGRHGHHHRQPLGRDGVHHPLAGVKPVEAAVFFRHKVDLACICRRIFGAVGNGLRAGRGLIIGQPVGAHGALGVHQRVKRDVVALGHTVVIEVMRAGDFYRAGAKIRIGIFIGDDRDHPAMRLRANRNFT